MYLGEPRDPYTEADVTTLPSIQGELEQTLSDVILQQPPSTVTHTLLAERKPMTREAIAAHIGKRTFEVEGMLAVLEVNGWVVRFPDNGLEKYILQAVNRGGQ